MLTPFLSLAAACAIIGAAASPIDKRFSLLSGKTVTVNGVVLPPGSRAPFGPNVFVGGPNNPICYAYCVNPQLPVEFRTKCTSQGCPTSAINPNAFYVLQDDSSIFKGDRLQPCQSGQVCIDGQVNLVNLDPKAYPA